MANLDAFLVLVFLVVALIFYLLFGGADFGAGVLEIFKGKSRRDEQQALISRAISPVWEANHIWLIIVIVILFMGFPPAYALLSIHLHIPLVLLLVAIVVRGCAFTFRHYDPEPGTRLYTALFVGGSLLAPLCFGLIIGAITAGRIDPQATDAYALYVAPWLHPFGALVGLLCFCTCVFLASAYLVGETDDAELQARFVRRALVSNVALVASGALVLLSAQRHGVFTLASFLRRPPSGGCFVVATLLLAPLWWALLRRRVWLARLLAATLVSLVIAGWLFTMYPFLTRLKGGGMSLAEALAPPQTVHQLALALCLGLCLVIPALLYLLRLFKGRPLAPDAGHG
jgi:cytochrome bd ubiquinol oxidase subunit II